MSQEPEKSELKNHKDKGEKKKRKHTESSGENSSPRKKSKSVSLENGYERQAQAAVPADQMQFANGNGTIQATTPEQSIPLKKEKKKKSKSALKDSESVSFIDIQDSVPETPKKNSAFSLPVHNEEISAFGKKSKSKDKMGKTSSKIMRNGISQEDTGEPMDIDAEPVIGSRDIEVDETPFINRPLRSVLSFSTSVQPVDRQSSPFFRQAVQFYLPVSPITLRSGMEGICAEHLSPLLLRYYPPLHGVILSYAGPRFAAECLDSQGRPIAISVGIYCTSMIWVEVEVMLFKPQRGHQVEGMIVLQSESHIGVQVYNLFSGRISKSRLPEDWVWVGNDNRNGKKSRKGKLKGSEEQQTESDIADGLQEDNGYWINSEGQKVEGLIKFQVFDVDIVLGGKDGERHLPRIEGTLVEKDLDAEDEQFRKEIRDARKRSKGKKTAG